ncbi:MAG TPA: AAA family ATPase [Nocardioides sp.]|nr:AAA family ATPase [Nocardioides sp.]
MGVGASGFTTSPGGGAPLLGRERELEVLRDLIDGIGTGGGTLVLRGDAGVGKSTLLEATRTYATQQRVAVLTATGSQLECRLAFGGLHQLLHPFLQDRDRLPDLQRSALDVAFGMGDGETPDVFLVGMATLGLLTTGNRKTPLLLVVDDAHWLDRSSLEVLAFVGRRLEMESVVLLFAVRTGEASVLDQARLPEVEVPGLNDGASRALLEVIGAGLLDDLKAQVLTQAAGNPLALIELPATVASLTPMGGWQPLPLSARLEAAFAARLDDLDHDVRTLLLLAAICEGDLGDLTRAAEDLLDKSIYLSDWMRAAATGLGTLDATRFRFRHPLMRSAVNQATAEAERRRAHAALARAFEGDLNKSVWHRAAAVDGADDDVADELVESAEVALARGAPDIAFAALERGAALTTDRDRRALRTVRAGQLAVQLGRPDLSVPLLRAALKLGLPPSQAVNTAFDLETLTGGWSGAAAIPRFADIAEDLAASGDNDGALQTIYDVAARAFWGPLDDSTRQRVSAIVADLDVAADDPVRLGSMGLIDPVQRGQELIELAARITPVDVVDANDLLALGMGANAVWADNLSLPFLRSSVSAYRAEGRLGRLGQALVYEAWADLHTGAVKMAITGAAEASSLSREAHNVRYVLAADLAHAIAAGQLGDEKTAERLISEAEAVLLPMGATPLLCLVALARGRTALAADRPGEAYADLLRIFNPTDAAYQPFVRGWALADLADAATRSEGDTDLVQRHLDTWREIATRTEAPHLQVQLAYADALLADDHDAEEGFRRAMTAGAVGWPYYTARAQLAYGEWLRRQHRDVDARGPLREAAQVFDALGQRAHADRALRELRASGVRSRQHDTDAWTELSPQELQIAQLAAEGLSNREIGERLYLSHRTVGTHLYNLFPKLGVTSRAQLRGALGASLDP